MKTAGIIETGLVLFDRYFVHIFVAGTHLFFICLGIWLGRWDLAVLGIVMFVLSFVAFEAVMRYGREEAQEEREGADAKLLIK